MKILELLPQEHILTDLQARNKMAALEELCSPICKTFHIPEETLLRVLLERERLGSTGIGEGVAIPHGKLDTLQHPALVFGKSRRGIPFDALDERPVHLFFMILTPTSEKGVHLQILARISKMLRQSDFKAELRRASDPKSIREIIAPLDENF